MAQITINELRRRKLMLEEKIKELVLDFYIENDIEVRQIDISYIDVRHLTAKDEPQPEVLANVRVTLGSV